MTKPDVTLCGMYPILATPFHDDETLDFESLEKLINYLVAEGIDGVVTLANASEGHLLSDAEKERLAAEVIRLVDGRVPTIISITHFSSRIAAEKAAWAEKEGASAVMTLPPFFGTWKSDVKSIKDYLRRISDSVSIPVMLQDHPLSNINLSVPDLCELITGVPGLEYLKMEVDSSATKVKDLLENAPDTFQGIFTGMGGVRLFWELEAGAGGCMPASIPAKPLADIIHLYWKGKKDESFDIFRKWLPFLTFVLRFGRRDAVKENLASKGIIASTKLREPNISAWNDWCRSQYEYLLERLEEK
ncbi:MAG: dihydrodipicolinate synthase family protein [Candidatus Latescibacteria bacterium]|nr:dihydrodipicolinate synthase family protein [Candidatus Latescibacterota bacterium]